MTDAPETIWRWAVQNCGGFIEYSDFPVISEHSTKYTRADVAQARIADLEAALRDVCQAVAWKEYGECRGWSDSLKPLVEALLQARAALKAKP